MSDREAQDLALYNLIAYRGLANGRTIMRTPDTPRRLFLRDQYGKISEIFAGSQTAQLLSLTPADWGEAKQYSPPDIVAAPAEPERRGFVWKFWAWVTKR